MPRVASTSVRVAATATQKRIEQQTNSGGTGVTIMAESMKDGVVIATQFSRLRRTAPAVEQSPQIDLGYEALAALSEAMEVLSDTLALSPGLSDARRLRLAERADLLEEHLRRLHPFSEGQDSSGDPSAGSSNSPKHAVD